MVSERQPHERMVVLARFLRNQISLADRPPPGCVQLNNEEAAVCATALERVACDCYPIAGEHAADCPTTTTKATQSSNQDLATPVNSGTYESKCLDCDRRMLNSDKRCFICTDCASCEIPQGLKEAFDAVYGTSPDSERLISAMRRLADAAIQGAPNVAIFSVPECVALSLEIGRLNRKFRDAEKELIQWRRDCTGKHGSQAPCVEALTALERNQP